MRSPAVGAVRALRRYDRLDGSTDQPLYLGRAQIGRRAVENGQPPCGRQPLRLTAITRHDCECGDHLTRCARVYYHPKGASSLHHTLPTLFRGVPAARRTPKAIPLGNAPTDAPRVRTPELRALTRPRVTHVPRSSPLAPSYSSLSRAYTPLTHRYTLVCHILRRIDARSRRQQGRKRRERARVAARGGLCRGGGRRAGSRARARDG